jgi:hypothetical protein
MFIKTIKLIYLLTTSTLICKSSISQIDRGSTKCNIENFGLDSIRLWPYIINRLDI